MRALTYLVAATLDGFIAGPDGGDPSGQEYFPITPDLVEFLVSTYPETLPGPARDAMGLTEPGATFDTVLEGRTSYEVGLTAGLNDAYPHLRHLVVSTTLSDLPAPAIELVRGDPLETVRRVKAEDGLGIWLVGGGTLAHSLLPEIDRIVVKLNPWVIGDGIPMFAGGFRPTGFTVTATVPLPGGVQVITLERQR